MPSRLPQPPAVCKHGLGWLLFRIYACRSINQQWPVDMWESSRVKISSRQMISHQLLISNIYGYSRDPTWPCTEALTSKLLAFITQRLIAGYNGLAAVTGGFNFDPDELDEFKVWRQFGWTHAQQHAEYQRGTPVKPTCKGRTQRDHFWMSPALSALCRQVQTIDLFADHTTLAADFGIQQCEQCC